MSIKRYIFKRTLGFLMVWALVFNRGLPWRRACFLISLKGTTTPIQWFWNILCGRRTPWIYHRFCTLYGRTPFYRLIALHCRYRRTPIYRFHGGGWRMRACHKIEWVDRVDGVLMMPAARTPRECLTTGILMLLHVARLGRGVEIITVPK